MTDDAAIMREPRWDFFISHAGSDLNVASRLKRGLESEAKVFLDKEDLEAGFWNQELPKVLRASLIYVVLVSQNTNGAVYQQEEVTFAIKLLREDPHTRRVVPVYLNTSSLPTNPPFGLLNLHSLFVPDDNKLEMVEKFLLRTLHIIKPYEAKATQVVDEQREAVARITGDGGEAKLIAGLSVATRFFHPLLKTLLALFGLMAALIVVCFLLPQLEHDERVLAATILGGLCAFLLASILWLTARSLSYTQQIALGRLNGG